MKTAFIKFQSGLKCVALAIALLFSFLSKAQTFSNLNSILISGDENKPGAVYRFESVKSGIDALVTIDRISSSAKLQSLSASGYGYAASFNPEMSINAGCWGYAVFDVQFVKSGGSTPVTFAHILFDNKKNIRIKYIDVEKSTGDVKISVVRSSKNSFKVMMYAGNLLHYPVKKSGNIEFKKFTCANIGLMESTVNLNGVAKKSLVQLKWQIDYPNTISSVILERSYDGSQFNSVNEYWVDNENINGTKFTYLDWVKQPLVYYRLKMISAKGNTVGYSNTMNFAVQNENDQNISITQFPVSSATNGIGANGLSINSNDQK